MFGIAAVVFGALGYLLNGLAAHTNSWFSPFGLGLLSLTCLALHLIGANSWLPRR